MPLVAEAARPHDLRGALGLLEGEALPQEEVAAGWGHFFVVREDDGRVVGVAGLEPHGEDGLLRSVCVDPGYRGQGLAGLLVEAALERAALLGMRSVYLLTTTAAAYFARHGFAEWSRDEAPEAIRASWEYRAGCPSTAVFMRRPIGKP